ncbi:type II CAAX endopeptidase family protein [Anaerolineales bacterium HSG24]|nr:type II CAAX endopeptidase family protein [Anaerolineales bacterium HSG24]
MIKNFSLNPTYVQVNNHLFELARSGKRLTHLALVLILGITFVLISQMIGLLIAPPFIVLIAFLTGKTSMAQFQSIMTNINLDLALLETPERFLAAPSMQALIRLLSPSDGYGAAIYLIALFGPVFLLLGLWSYFFEKRPFWTLGFEGTNVLLQYGRGMGVAFVTFSAAVGLAAMMGYIDIEQGSPQRAGMLALDGVIIIFLGWMVQGAAEEVLTRGWMMPIIGARYNRPWLGIIISSLYFGVLHLCNNEISIIAMLNLFLVGLFASLYALWEGGLWGVCGFHSTWNWTQGNILGFEVSGNPQVAGTLINLEEIGPDIITGGGFGPEGGLAVTVVLLVSCGVMWWLGRDREAINVRNEH